MVKVPNLGRKMDRIRKAERKLVRLSSRGVRPRRLMRLVMRIDALKDRLEIQKNAVLAAIVAADPLQTANV